MNGQQRPLKLGITQPTFTFELQYSTFKSQSLSQTLLKSSLFTIIISNMRMEKEMVSNNKHCSIVI